VIAVYKKALARYGDVLRWEDKKPVGTPTTTAEGLTCAEGGDTKVRVEGNDFGWHDGMELKAGWKRHQHIVGFDTDSKSDKKTTFGLVALDLPSGTDNSDKSD